MRIRTAVSVGLSAALVAGAFSPAAAGHKSKAKPKPIKKTYTATAFPPDPTPFIGDPCTPNIPGARHSHQFKVPAAGRLKVDIDKFTGDWALGLRDAAGEQIAFSDGATPETDEAMDVKFKKGQMVTIDACNFAGGPTAEVTYVFTYA